MSCFCCKNPLKVCNPCSGATIIIDYVVPIGGDGTYVLSLDFAGSLVRLNSPNLTAGQLLEFDLSQASLNENYIYKGQILKPNGDVLELTGTDETFDCIELQTTIGGLGFVSVKIP